MFTCLPLDGTGYKLQRRIYEKFRAIKSVIASTCIYHRMYAYQYTQLKHFMK